MRFLVVLACLFIGTKSFAYTEPVLGDETKDILAYAKSHVEFSDKGFIQLDSSTHKNLVFISSVNNCGTGSCEFMMFDRKGNGEAVYVDTLPLKAGGFEFLKTFHNGYPDIKIYHHLSKKEGSLSTMEFNGKEYKMIGKAKTIPSNDFAKAITPEKVIQKDLK